MNQMELQLKLDELENNGCNQSYLMGFRKGWEEQHYRIDGMERREVTFRSEIEHREDFIRRLMAELRQHGWGDFRFGTIPQDPKIVALLEEGAIYENVIKTIDINTEPNRFEAAEGYRIEFGDGTVVESQEGTVYERGSDQSGASPEAAGT